ncbi:hypothetical protein Scep_021774 [Stephania cephalantha]|uniref:Uncharacterized protein n=1 Tax=Stephania cephalantha TaxID=152367 RepID=A0AAP0F6M8_9MAGN
MVYFCRSSSMELIFDHVGVFGKKIEFFAKSYEPDNPIVVSEPKASVLLKVCMFSLMYI